MDRVIERHVRTATTNDFEQLITLLQTENLPTEDISRELSHFFVIAEAGNIIGAIGLELYGKNGLLRSLIVDRYYRNQSLASILLDALLVYAAKQGINSLYLITTTAEKYFARKTFTVISRALIPLSISSSREFSTLCPATATVMLKNI